MEAFLCFESSQCLDHPDLSRYPPPTSCSSASRGHSAKLCSAVWVFMACTNWSGSFPAVFHTKKPRFQRPWPMSNGTGNEFLYKLGKIQGKLGIMKVWAANSEGWYLWPKMFLTVTYLSQQSAFPAIFRRTSSNLGTSKVSADNFSLAFVCKSQFSTGT